MKSFKEIQSNIKELNMEITEFNSAKKEYDSLKQKYIRKFSNFHKLSIKYRTKKDKLDEINNNYPNVAETLDRMEEQLDIDIEKEIKFFNEKVIRRIFIFEIQNLCISFQMLSLISNIAFRLSMKNELSLWGRMILPKKELML